MLGVDVVDRQRAQFCCGNLQGPSPLIAMLFTAPFWGFGFQQLVGNAPEGWGRGSGHSLRLDWICT